MSVGRGEDSDHKIDESAEEQEFLVIPNQIDGLPVRSIVEGAVSQFGDFRTIRRVYLDCRLQFDQKPYLQGNVEKVFHIRPSETAQTWTAEEYGRSIDRIEKKDWQNSETLLDSRANVSYFFNFDGAENDGFHWIDDYDGEPIVFVPPDPQRKGYTFAGWYKEPKCLNRWDFAKDKVSAKEYDEDGNYLYRETKLYAKWQIL